MTTEKPGAFPVNKTTLWAVVTVLIAVLVAGVALALSGMEAAGIIALLTGLATIGGTLVAVLDKVTTVHRINADQDAKIDVIEERTNGGLEPRIQKAVQAALEQRFGSRTDTPSGGL